MSILKLIAAAFFRELLSAVAGYFTARQATEQAVKLGRAEATRDAAMEAAERAEAMNGVPLPDDAEVLRRLRDGSA